MDAQFFQKYANQFGGLIDDSTPLDAAVTAFLLNCQYYTKKSISILSDFEEIYEYRPELIVGFLNTEKKAAFMKSSEDMCFIGISLGLVLTIHNILYEAVGLDQGFMDYYFKDHYNQVDKKCSRKISRFIFSPPSIDFLTEEFKKCRKLSLDKEVKETLDAIVYTALDFICKHELAHFFREHETFVYNDDRVEFFDEEIMLHAFERLASGNEVTFKKQSFNRAMESDADTQAIIMALRENEVAYPDLFLENQIDQESVFDIVYELGLAIGVLFVCLDNQKDIQIQYKERHPPSYVRFQYIMYIIIEYCHVLYDTDKNDLVEKNIDISLEMENLAILLGYKEGIWIRTDKPVTGKFLDIDNLLPISNDEYQSMIPIIEKIDKHAKYNFISLE